MLRLRISLILPCLWNDIKNAEVTGCMKLHFASLLQGLLAFYGLPLPHMLVEISAHVPVSLPHGVQFQFQTLPVNP